ncbi:MAG: hypothetical protein AAF532_01285 [Planctomycetota bacterium]
MSPIDSLESLYVVVGCGGGVLFVGQLLLSFLGLSGDELDADAGDADFDPTESPEFPADGTGVGAWLIGLFSFRSVAAAAAMFGVVGFGLRETFDPGQGLAFASAACFGTLWFVSWLFGQLAGLENDGTVSARDALGGKATVSLSVPAAGEGEGKVNVAIGDRTVELYAASEAAAFPTGSVVTVTEVLDDRRVRVGPSAASETV